jgi:hypothetical protein
MSLKCSVQLLVTVMCPVNALVNVVNYTVKPIYGTIHVKYSETYFTYYTHGLFRVFSRFRTLGLARYIPGFWTGPAERLLRD